MPVYLVCVVNETTNRIFIIQGPTLHEIISTALNVFKSGTGAEGTIQALELQKEVDEVIVLAS